MELKFINLRIFNGGFEDLISIINKSLKNNAPSAVHFAAAHAFVESDKDIKLRRIFETDVVVCDSAPLARYLQLKDKTFKQLRGTTFMRRAFQEVGIIHGRHILLGGNPKTNRTLVEKLKQINSGANIVGSFAPSFTTDINLLLSECETFIGDLNPDFIWVGLGAPKQFFIASKLSTQYSCVTFSVGAAFDFISGNSSEAPMFMQKIYLEWFYRFLQEPIRLFKRYFMGNLIFMCMLARDTMSYLKQQKETR